MARDHNSVEKRPEQRQKWHNRLLAHLTFIFLVTISLVQQRVCRMILLLPRPFHLWFPHSFLVRGSNKSVLETDNARASTDARHGG